MAEIIWKDRKRPFLGLPWSFTKYELTDQKLIINKGFLNVSEEEVRLYRFVDVTMTQTLGQRIFGVGNLHCETNDRSSGNFVIELVKNPRQVKEILSDTVEAERDRKRVSVREFMADMDDGADTDADDMDVNVNE
ncbi:MAG: PH domain-containing protein [Lachnospiraceae bacterium]|nr:PH domain-containing protein [Lachnospiraceae bacterium]